MNVLKQHLQSAIFTLLERGVSQHRIHELTGIDRKTIRRYQALYEARRADGANSSTAATTGSGDPVVAQNPPLLSRGGVMAPGMGGVMAPAEAG
ncbi:integrase catalytic subunit [Burkholderia sp. SJ98]|nr:integrase [Caballeronia zhejiangensis]EKS69097.1 integrase catalytic subunit [Burkholderia sp. SJ98]